MINPKNKTTLNQKVILLCFYVYVYVVLFFFKVRVNILNIDI